MTEDPIRAHLDRLAGFHDGGWSGPNELAMNDALRAVLDLCDPYSNSTWAVEVRRVIADNLGVTDE